MSDAAEWAIWEAASGYVVLANGQRVLVQGGDEVLMTESGDEVVFYEHRPAVRH